MNHHFDIDFDQNSVKISLNLPGIVICIKIVIRLESATKQTQKSQNYSEFRSCYFNILKNFTDLYDSVLKLVAVEKPRN